jgi:fructuronate reductase
VAKPGYDIGKVAIGIVHLGLGAFHRAHQAVLTDSLLASDPRWGICGVSLKSPRICTALKPQDGSIRCWRRASTRRRRASSGRCAKCCSSARSASGLLARLAAPAVQIVSLTVTEKGYCHDPATGRLNFKHPEILHDLETPQAPVSTIGVLTAGLSARRAAGRGADHRRVLRQPPAQRTHRRGNRPRLCASGGPVARGVGGLQT